MIKKLSLILLALTCFSSEVNLFSMARRMARRINFPKVKKLINTTPLMHAAQAGDVITVKHLIQSGVDIDATDSYGRTALMYAIHPGSNEDHLKVVQFLVENRANINYVAGIYNPRNLAYHYAIIDNQNRFGTPYKREGSPASIWSRIYNCIERAILE